MAKFEKDLEDFNKQQQVLMTKQLKATSHPRRTPHDARAHDKVLPLRAPLCRVRSCCGSSSSSSWTPSGPCLHSIIGCTAPSSWWPPFTLSLVATFHPQLAASVLPIFWHSLHACLQSNPYATGAPQEW